jgi:hypothetical protein
MVYLSGVDIIVDLPIRRDDDFHSYMVNVYQRVNFLDDPAIYLNRLSCPTVIF